MDENKDHTTGEISLMELWSIIMKRKKVIMIFVPIITIVVAIYSLLLPKYYAAGAVLMPISSGGGMRVGGGLGALLGGIGGMGMGDANSKKMMVLLESRTLAEDIVKKHDLATLLLPQRDPKPPNKASRQKIKDQEVRGAIKALRDGMKFSDNSEKNGTMTVSAEFRDPELVVNIVNWYLQGLQDSISKNAFTSAKLARVFIEKRLAQNKRELFEDGKELNSFYRDGRISSVESNIDIPIVVGSEKIIFPIVASPDMKIVNTDLNHQKEKLKHLQEQKEKMEQILIVEDVPQQVYLKYLTMKLNLLTQINGLLMNEYEMAKIEESKNELAFQIIDPPIVPENRSRPRRRQMVMLAFATSLFVGIFVAFIMEYIEKVKIGVKT